MQEKWESIGNLFKEDKPKRVDPETAQPNFASPNPAHFPPHCKYFPPNVVDSRPSDIFEISQTVSDDGSSAVGTQRSSFSGPVSLAELSAREDRAAQLIRKHTKFGFYECGGQQKWALGDGLGGICVFTEIYPRGTLQQAIMLLTGESDKYSALAAFECRARYPHLSFYSMQYRYRFSISRLHGKLSDLPMWRKSTLMKREHYMPFYQSGVPLALH